jgi:group I intron endonuclease
VLEVCDRRDTRIIEQRWIDKYTPFYNMSLKVGSNDGHTYDTKIKISKLQGGKPIDVCNLDGEVITTVNMQREAAEFVNGNQSKVWKCLEGINYKHRNYRFKYSGEDFTYVNRRYPTKSMLGKKHSEETKSKMGLAMSRGKFKGKLEVYLGDKKVCEYLSLKEASEDLDIKSAGISKSLKTGKLYKGYSFKKIELKEL